MSSNHGITRIVITGGPCAGKTSCMTAIKEWLTQQGYVPIFIDEIATRLQTSGIYPIPEYLPQNEFERTLLQTQISNEEIFEKVGQKIEKQSGKKVVIIQDRCILDIAAYIGIEALEDLLKEENRSLNAELQKYNAVIYLVSAANGALHAYTTANNTARTETPEEARSRDNKTYQVYAANTHIPLFRITNQGDFKRKKLDTLNAINSVLGLPLIGENQKKYIISFDGINQIISQHGGTHLFIKQTYLHGTNSNFERRLRFISDENKQRFYSVSETRYLRNGERIKRERMISEREYCALMQSASPDYNTIKKERYCINTKTLYIELDIFHNPRLPHGIIEVKTLGDQKTPDISQIPGIFEEITSNPSYLNKEIAKKQ